MGESSHTLTHLKSKGEGRFAVQNGGQEARNVEGGRNLHQVDAAQPANGLPCLNLQTIHTLHAGLKRLSGVAVQPLTAPPSPRIDDGSRQ